MSNTYIRRRIDATNRTVAALALVTICLVQVFVLFLFRDPIIVAAHGDALNLLEVFDDAGLQRLIREIPRNATLQPG